MQIHTLFTVAGIIVLCYNIVSENYVMIAGSDAGGKAGTPYKTGAFRALYTICCITYVFGKVPLDYKPDLRGISFCLNAGIGFQKKL